MCSRAKKLAVRIIENPEESDWYSKYGHSRSKVPPFLWVWADGSLQVKKGVENSTGYRPHQVEFPEYADKFVYSGRYDPNTRTITLVRPGRFKEYEVPNSLLNALMKKFPDVEYIRYF